MDAQVAAWFRSIDADGSGSLDASELQRALALGNLHYSLTDVVDMIRAFAPAQSAGGVRLDLAGFARLHTFLTNVQAAFAAHDRDRSGALTPDEARAALSSSGFVLERPAMDALFAKYAAQHAAGPGAPVGAGSLLRLDAFIRLALACQTLARVFSSYDPQRSGFITLNFSQLAYVYAHVSG